MQTVTSNDTEIVFGTVGHPENDFLANPKTPANLPRHDHGWRVFLESGLTFRTPLSKIGKGSSVTNLFMFLLAGAAGVGSTGR